MLALDKPPPKREEPKPERQRPSPNRELDPDWVKKRIEEIKREERRGR